MINKIIKQHNILKNKGYALIEILFYIAIFSLLFIVIINSLIVMTKSFKETTINGEFIQSGAVVEKISREIKKAYGINSITATSLILDSKDESNNNKTVQFLLSNSNIQFIDNGTLVGNLNTPNIQVVDLSFEQITTLKSKAIKMFMTFSSTHDSQNRIKDFYTTVVLRGSY